MNLLFITGPVRSGKSRFATLSALQSGRPVTYVATAARNAEDAEWTDRIERHRSDRPVEWHTIETAGSGSTLRDALLRCAPESIVVIDSVGTWLADQLSQFPHDAAASNMLQALVERAQAFIETLMEARSDVIVVSEETGWGIVPEHVSGRVFRDALGFTNQRLARLAQKAYLVVCGYAFDLKSALPIGDLQ